MWIEEKLNFYMEKLLTAVNYRPFTRTCIQDKNFDIIKTYNSTLNIFVYLMHYQEIYSTEGTFIMYQYIATKEILSLEELESIYQDKLFSFESFNCFGKDKLEDVMLTLENTSKLELIQDVINRWKDYSNKT